MRKLETFHHRCVRCIMGIGHAEQWAEHITTTQLAERFGMCESVSILLSLSILRWLEHVAHMPDDRIPKRILFGWLPMARPAHGVKLRWRDKVKQDLRNFSINDCLWYQQAQDRDLWKQLSNGGVENLLAVPHSKPNSLISLSDLSKVF